MQKLMTLLIVSTTLIHGLSAIEPENVDYAQIAQRPIPVEDLQLLIADRAQIQEEERANEADGGNALLSKQGNIYVVDRAIYAPSQHVATVFSPDGRIVELEDESQWLITVKDVSKAAKWLTNDPIAIYPNKDFFWKATNYKLTNLSFNETVDVDLIRGPKLNSVYTKYVTAVDTYFDSIYLNDGSRWDLSWADSSITRHWMPNDIVIVGDNYGWYSSSYPSILINVSLNQYVCAKRAF